ncbi:MAG: DUF4347 domain-containing protein [Okeania sp. SIO3B3]|nr:DUF4347 domain-containing protein [Okeania sp. SIO3B3]
MSTINIYQSLSTKKSIEFFDFSTEAKTEQQVVFIDSHVEDYQGLATGVLSGIKVVILHQYDNGIEQITKVIKKYPQISSIHIVSHGSPGCLELGNSQLNIESINNSYAEELETWSVTNILLYGCSVAASDVGREFLEKLHQLTGANIAASARPTGSAALGGDWELEVTTGEIEVGLAFSDRVKYQWEHILAAFVPQQPYFYQVISGQLKIFNPLTSSYEDLGGTHTALYNATGYNTQDDFIYGLEVGGDITTGKVIKINSDGTVEDLLIGTPPAPVTISGVKLNAGDVDNDGNLWVKTGNTQLTRINLTTGAKTPFNALPGETDSLATVADIVYYNPDGSSPRFYGVGNDRKIYAVDIDLANDTLTITPSNTVNGFANITSEYGAAWIVNNGTTADLYVSRNKEDSNNQGELYIIKDIVNEFTDTSPTAVSVATTIPTTENDGVSDPRQPSPFDVPFIDPDPDTSAFTYEATFIEDDEDNPSVGIVSDGVDLRDFDTVTPVTENIGSAEIKLTNSQTDDELFVDPDLPFPTTRITATIMGNEIKLEAVDTTLGATPDDFETALKAIQFRNTSDTPNTTPREVTIQLKDTDGTEGGNPGNIATTTIHVIPTNDAPSFQNLESDDDDPIDTDDDDQTFIVGGSAVVIDGNATVADPELDDRNYGGATLTLAREGGANSDDEFSNTGVLGALTESGPLTVSGTTIGEVTTNSNGTLELTFNSSATTALVNQALQSITYSNSNSNPPTEVDIKYTINDKNIEKSRNGVNTGEVIYTASETIPDTPEVDYSGAFLIIEIDGTPDSNDVFGSNDTSGLAGRGP